MTTPTQQEALVMARRAGFNSSPMYPSSVIVRHSNGSFVDVTSRIEALVTAAYKLGREDAHKQRGTMLFNPYSGAPRNPLDIQSDPHGILMVDPDEPLHAAIRNQGAKT